MSEQIRYWQESLAKAPFAEYVAQLDDLREAFELNDCSLRCIDEGCAGGVRLAGSGILYQEKSQEALHGKVDGIYSHEGCGAAALYARQNGLDTSNSDQYGIEWAKRLAKRLGVPYKGHIGIDEMKRPKQQHIAQVVYYDGSGCFDPYRLEGKFPPGFVISRKLLDSKYAQEELKVSIGIALGDHGLGEHFTSETPFLIVPIGNPSDAGLDLDTLTQEANAVAEQFNGRVAVSGFTAPLI